MMDALELVLWNSSSVAGVPGRGWKGLVAEEAFVGQDVDVLWICRANRPGHGRGRVAVLRCA